MTDKRLDDKAQDTTHRAWERLVFARTPIEAIMIESFLAGEGIETRQPFERHLMYDAGIGPGVAGEPGVRIDVPADQFKRAKELLDERTRLVREGTLSVDAEASELTNMQELEAKIQSHTPAKPTQHGADTFMRALFPALGILGITLGAKHYFDADQAITIESFISHQSEGVFVAIVGIAFIFAGVLHGRKPNHTQTTQAPTTPLVAKPSSLGFVVGTLLMFAYSFVIPTLGIVLYLSESTASPGDSAVMLFLAAIFLLPTWATWLATALAIWRNTLPAEHKTKVLLRYYVIGAMAPICLLPPIMMFQEPNGEMALTIGFSIVAILLLWKHLIPAQLRDLRPAAIPLTPQGTKADHGDLSDKASSDNDQTERGST